jgi:hypothetical protein
MKLTENQVVRMNANFYGINMYLPNNMNDATITKDGKKYKFKNPEQYAELLAYVDGPKPEDWVYWAEPDLTELSNGEVEFRYHYRDTWLHARLICDGDVFTKWTSDISGDIVRLEKDDFLIKNYGKYWSGLGIIIPKDHPLIEKDKKYLKMWTVGGDKFKDELNISNKSSLKYLRGRYFESKKGTKLFKADPNGPHYLLQDDWGGCFASYWGRTLPEDQLYYKRASSNGGGSGYDYAVIPVGWKQVLKEEDL